MVYQRFLVDATTAIGLQRDKEMWEHQIQDAVYAHARQGVTTHGLYPMD